jgi:hypothetical protein
VSKASTAALVALVARTPVIPDAMRREVPLGRSGIVEGCRGRVGALYLEDGPGSAPHRSALRRARDDEERAHNPVILDAMRREVPRGRSGIVEGCRSRVGPKE